MAEWDTIFAGVRDITRNASTISDGVSKAIEFAKKHPNYFGEPDKLDELELQRFPIEAYFSWAQTGLSKLNEGSGSAVLLLDLNNGDIFRIQEVTDKCNYRQEIQDISLHRDYFDLFECNSLDQLMKQDRRGDLNSDDVLGVSDVVTYYLYQEEISLPLDPLEHDDDAWTYAGYLTSLVMGSMALLQASRHFGTFPLNGRKSLNLYAGFETLFTYVATVTPNGVEFKEQ